MVEINLNNIVSKINGLDDRLVKLISNKLAYQEVFDSVNGIVYTGLVPYAIKILKDNNIKFIINDLRVAPKR